MRERGHKTTSTLLRTMRNVKGPEGHRDRSFDGRRDL